MSIKLYTIVNFSSFDDYMDLPNLKIKLIIDLNNEYGYCKVGVKAKDNILLQLLILSYIVS